MYKVMIADDEGIVRQSLTMMIEKSFGTSCQIETARTGRGAIELAQKFRPDIAFMDIQMPGINGMDAVEEIKKFCQSTYFIIITAYDQFNYAKKAIDLGVIEFMTKPFNKKRIIDVMQKTMTKIDEQRLKRENDLKNKEKLEIVIPIIESSMIYTILVQEDYGEKTDQFRTLLDIQEDYGFMMVIGFGDKVSGTSMTNPIGIAVKAQKFYMELRQIIKDSFNGYVGSVMTNKVAVLVPCLKPTIEYNERVKIIEQVRNMVHRLQHYIDVEFKVGIGSVVPMEKLLISYKEAVKAMRMVKGCVSHIKDIVPQSREGENTVIELEKALIFEFKRSDLTGFLQEVVHVYEQLVNKEPEELMLLKAKLFEFLIIIQQEVKKDITSDLKIENRDLIHILECQRNELKQVFIENMTFLYEYRESMKKEVYSETILRAKALIDAYYYKDMNLEAISREVNVSPYYFSKIFKEETGKNFIDYITCIRIEKAKEALKEKNRSIKEICIKVGYKDPNYFSRLFKKQVGVTPTEYREEV